MRSTRIAAAAALFAIGSAAVAHGDMGPADLSDPVSLRMHMMKNVGAAMGALGGMAKGEIAYDAALAEQSFRVMNSAALGFAAQFPEGSATHDSEASPKIWSDAAGFEAAAAKFLADTASAMAAKPADKDAFMPVFGQVAANCKGCHQDYRVKKN
ncbi:c-type cytochrome [Rhodovulum sp. DZ06]|uniref:c-type cytochrome n=1 Tax=Rhodovulum sp. DZ06 TaxID=3425126 RepID=UPI003D32C0F4